MRIYRFSILLVFITLLALLYVHQQVHLLKISYNIALSEKELTSLLDQNRSLVYNITSLKSPVYLEKKFLASKKNYAIPQQWQVVEVVAPSGEKKQPALVARAQKENFGILRMLLRPKEALAKTIK